MKNKKNALTRLVLTAGIFLTAPAAMAADYPNHPIKLVVGYSAGGATDAMARLLANRLSVELNQQVIVENRAGAAGLIAGEYVARSAPDGYTLLIGNTTLLVMPALRPHTDSRLVRSLYQIAGVAVAPLIVVSGPKSDLRSPKDLAAKLHADPKSYSYGSPGVGSVHSIAFEMFLDRVDGHAVHVPYGGATQVVTDVASGQIPIGVVSAASAIGFLKGGKVQGVASLGTTKLPGLENIPAVAEVVPGYDIAERFIIMTPAGTPTNVTQRLNEALKKVVNEEKVKEAAVQQGMVAVYTPPAELGAFVSKQVSELEEIIKKQHISLD